MTSGLPIEETSDGVIINTKVKPGAGKSRVKGVTGGILSIDVKAQPEGGRANREVEKLVAKTAGLPKDSVKITSGKKSRRKRIRLTGITKAELEDRLANYF